MSTKTGVAPVITMVEAEATKENAGVRTSSPGPTPRATSARRSASVPDATPTAWRTPHVRASSCSSARPSPPRTNWPEARRQHAAHAEQVEREAELVVGGLASELGVPVDVLDRQRPALEFEVDAE